MYKINNVYNSQNNEQTNFKKTLEACHEGTIRSKSAFCDRANYLQHSPLFSHSSMLKNSENNC